MKYSRKQIFLHTVELIVDKIIPYLLVVLMFIIIVDLFYVEFAQKYYLYIDIVDYFIIFVFLIDLYFKWTRASDWKTFLKTSWLDIIAVLPFYLIFRIFEEISILASVGEGVQRSQQIIHETVEFEKEAAKIAQEVEKVGNITRTERFAKFLKPVLRAPRFLKATTIYERPLKKKNKFKK